MSDIKLPKGVEIRSLWDGDTFIFLVYVDGEHRGSHWTYEDARDEAITYGTQGFHPTERE